MTQTEILKPQSTIAKKLQIVSCINNLVSKPSLKPTKLNCTHLIFYI